MSVCDETENQTVRTAELVYRQDFVAVKLNVEREIEQLAFCSFVHCVALSVLQITFTLFITFDWLFLSYTQTSVCAVRG